MTRTVTVESRHRRRPIWVLALAATFGVGLATGLVVPRSSADVARIGSALQSRAFTGVAVNNMSDAARAASYDGAKKLGAFTGVAVNNMSDAANRALHGEVSVSADSTP